MVTLIPAPRFVCLWGYDRSLENRTKCVDINKLYVKLTTRWMPLSESSINFYLRFKTNHSTSLIVFLSFFLSFFLIHLCPYALVFALSLCFSTKFFSSFVFYLLLLLSLAFFSSLDDIVSQGRLVVRC